MLYTIQDFLYHPHCIICIPMNYYLYDYQSIHLVKSIHQIVNRCTYYLYILTYAFIAKHRKNLLNNVNNFRCFTDWSLKICHQRLIISSLFFAFYLRFLNKSFYFRSYPGTKIPLIFSEIVSSFCC